MWTQSGKVKARKTSLPCLLFLLRSQFKRYPLQKAYTGLPTFLFCITLPYFIFFILSVPEMISLICLGMCWLSSLRPSPTQTELVRAGPLSVLAQSLHCPRQSVVARRFTVQFHHLMASGRLPSVSGLSFLTCQMGVVIPNGKVVGYRAEPGT